MFTRAHGVSVGPDNTLYCTDDGDHTVRQCTLDGEVLMTIGVPNEPAAAHSNKPFNRCTHVATDPANGDLFVSDGYGNGNVHKFTPDGEHITTWGSPGVDAGQFNIVHNIATDRDGYVYVCDRENHRVQVFDRDGKLEDVWYHLHRPCAIYISDDQRVYVGELGFGMAVNRYTPNIGPRVAILNTAGKVLDRLGNGWATATASTPVSSSRRTVSAWTRRTASTWPRSRTPTSAITRRRRRMCERFRSWRRPEFPIR